MKKISLIITAMLIMLCLAGCGNNIEQQKENYAPEENSMAQKLSSIYEKTDNKEQQIYDMWMLFDEERKANGWFMYDNVEPNVLLLSTSSGEECNPYKEVAYDYTENRRWLEYRYVCQNDVCLFNEDVVIQDMKRIFGLDLTQTQFTKISEQLKQKINEIKDGETIKDNIFSFENIDVIISIAKLDGTKAMAIHCGYSLE